MKASHPVGVSRKKFFVYMSLDCSTLCYKAKGEGAENLELMEVINHYYLGHPTIGALYMQSMLTLKGHQVNVKRVHRLILIRLMHLIPVYSKPSLSMGTIPMYVRTPICRVDCIILNVSIRCGVQTSSMSLWM